MRAPPFTRITAAAIHGQTRCPEAVGAAVRCTVARVGTLAARWRFCSAFLRASRI
jgi:hypothetical protein